MSGERRSFHVLHTYPNDVGLACPPVAFCLRQDMREIPNQPRPFWVKPLSTFGLLPVYDVYQRFTCR